MFLQTAGLICSEWGMPVKAILIAIVSAVLLAVICLLVVEAVGKKDISALAPRNAAPETDTDTETETEKISESEPEEAEPEKEQLPESESETVEPETQISNKEDEKAEPELETAASGGEIALDDAATIEDGDNDTGTMIVGDTRIQVRYSRSFAAALAQSDDTLKGLYNSVKNDLVCYKLKPRSSWSNESFYSGRTTYAKFAIRGKTLSLYIALDPDEYKDTKYSFRDERETAKYRDVPMQLKIKSERAARRAKELIAAMAEKHGLPRVEVRPENYRPDYKTTEALVKDKLIKLFCVAAPDRSRQELESAAIADIKAKDKTPRDFTTRLMRADNETKARYSAIKNELLRYGMKPRMSTGNESWFKGRTTYAKFAIRGKTLSLYLALDPQEFADSKYSFRNESDVGKYETVPMRVNLKSDRSVRYVKELIAALAEKHGLARAERTEEDFRYVEKKRKKK